MQASSPTPISTAPDLSVGFDIAKIPIDRETIQSRRLLRMIELLEVLKAPGEDRTLWQLMLDAGAAVDFIRLRDCNDDLMLGRRPALQVQVSTAKHQGFLIITHDDADRGFKVLLQDSDSSIARVTVDKVIVRNLGQVLFDLVDDGQRRFTSAKTPQGNSEDALLAP